MAARGDDALRYASGVERDRLAKTLRAGQISLLEALIVIVRRADMAASERVVLGTALGAATEQAAPGERAIPTMLRVLDDPPPKNVPLTVEHQRPTSRLMAGTPSRSTTIATRTPNGTSLPPATTTPPTPAPKRTQVGLIRPETSTPTALPAPPRRRVLPRTHRPSRRPRPPASSTRKALPPRQRDHGRGR
jgi:hypothetical protein